MSERFGVAVAIVSSSCGAAAAVATRYLIGAADPFTLAAIRFGGGVLCLLPLVLLLPVRWPPRQDWPAVAGLGLMFYAVFFVLLQRGARLHDGGARHAGALHPAAHDHAGRRRARHRGAERPKDRRRAGGDAGRRRRAGLGAGARAGQGRGAAT